MNIAFPSPIKRALAAAAITMIVLGLFAPRAAKAQTYSIDDGTAENSVGLTAGGTPTFFNSFPTILGSNLITSISISFGSQTSVEALNGLPYTVGLWSDPNGDGLPGDAVLLTSMPGVISGANSNTFVTSLITPQLVLTPNFFVGFVITHGAGLHPAGFDQTAPTLAGRSWVVPAGNINNLTGAITIESAGLVGNWLIRANSAIPEPSTYALVALALAGMLFFARRTRRVAR